MASFTATALFCEDIREEIGGTFTIVGVMPDNVEVPSFPVLISKLAIYVRANIDPAFNPGSITLRIKVGDGPANDVATMDPKVVAQTMLLARETRIPMAGLVLRTMMQNLPIRAPGRITALVRTSQEEVVVGFLNIVGTANRDATASAPPA